MTESYYIVDTPLPVSQDFEMLKDRGLSYIQDHMGNEWNNLNPSDPGITILDQLVYALTELGYCNDFSIADILTGLNGKLQIKDQFYLPEEILSTSPVTIDDYVKYLVDGVEGIDNALILPYTDPDTAPSEFNKFYRVYLLVDLRVPPAAVDDLCTTAFYYLNKCRNIGELFLMPVPLRPARYFLSGNIELAKGTDQANIVVQMQTAIRNYIFPAVSQSAYSQITPGD